MRAMKLAAKVRQRLTDELGGPVKVILFGSQARSFVLESSSGLAEDV